MNEETNSSVPAAAGQYLSFYLNDQLYGVAIETVREINRVTEITSIPQTPVFIAGVVNLRGKVIPVVNLRVKFGIPSIGFTRQTCIVVVESDFGQVGMIVDSIKEVLVLSQDQIEPAPVMGNVQNLAYVTGMGKVENSVLILVDIVKALSREQLTGLTEVAERFQKAS